MKILRLTADNIKRLIAVDITPGDRAVVRIHGKNGMGKSSVLDAIMMALGGERAIPSKPIREGATNAEVGIDLGELVVHRRFTRTKSYLEVTSKDGLPQKSPQAILDKLVGDLAFDPLDFIRLAPKSQLEQLAAITDLKLDRAGLVRVAAGAGVEITPAGTDLQVLEAFERGLAENRTVANAAAKQATAAAVGADQVKDPGEPIDINDIVKRRREREAERLAFMEKKQARFDLERRFRDMATQIEETRARLATLELGRTGVGEQLAALPELGEPPTFDDLDAIVATAVTQNDAAAEYKRAQLKLVEMNTARGAVENAENALGAFRSYKTGMMAAAEFPVPDLSFGDGEVLFKGLPLDQASDAERLRVAVAIAMSANPKLRVIRIRDGSLLDSNGMALLEELAKTRDFQVWVEQVAEGAGVGVHIEDGEIDAVDGKAT